MTFFEIFFNAVTDFVENSSATRAMIVFYSAFDTERSSNTLCVARAETER